MREILFGGKAINIEPGRRSITHYKNGDWVYGLIQTPYNNLYSKYIEYPVKMINEVGMSDIDIDFNTIGQYTGLTDYYNNWIFEGDILENIASERGVVKWFNAMFVIDFDDTYLNFDQVWSCDYKVVGNIYDNEGLLYEAECLEDALEKVTEDFDSRKTTFDADNFELCVIEEYKEDREWAKVKLMRNL